MRPTDKQTEDAAIEYAENTIAVGDKDFLLEVGFTQGANWAISQMQPEWVSVEDELPGDETYATIWRKGYSPEQTVARQVFNMTHACYCFIDNSLNTYQIGEVVTHWIPLLEPPTK